MVSVSIVVPVYGVEKYLNRCVDSLLAQTQKDIEIILIDDASKDNSSSIMRDYENRYPDRIKCIYLKENMKQGGARNVGIRAAVGEYMLFVDSDDWVASDLCEKLYSAAVKTGSDLVLCDNMKIYEDSGDRKYVMEVGFEINGELTDDKHKLLLSMIAYPFSKLIRRSILIDNSLFFAEKIKYEDFAVVPFFSLYAKIAYKVNEALYYYNIREGSTTQERNSYHHFERMNSAIILLDRSKAWGFYEKFKEEIDFLFMRGYCFHMLECCLNQFDEIPYKKMREIRDNMNILCPNYQNNYYVNKMIDPSFLKIANLNNIGPEQLRSWYRQKGKEVYDYRPYYLETRDRAKSLLTYCKEKEYTIALWGAGRKGTEFLCLNDDKQEQIKYVIDLNPDKQGTRLQTGHCITSFEDVKEKVDVILVSNKYYFGNIFSLVKQNNRRIHVINLDLILTYRINIEDYFAI